MGFLAAARRGEAGDRASVPRYQAERPDATTLAQQLFVVLDARLPARLTQISDAPEGSRANPLRPDQELVGTIRSARGDVDVVVERVPSGGSGPIWLFSQATLRGSPGAVRGSDDWVGPGASPVPDQHTRGRDSAVRVDGRAARAAVLLPADSCC